MSAVSLVTAGGVGIEVPDDVRLVTTGSHGAAFGRPDGPALVVRDVPVRLTVESWWEAVAAANPTTDRAAVLVDVVERSDGFVAEHAWLDDDRSMTTCTRVVDVPGRSLVVSVAVKTASVRRRRDEIDTLFASITVDGLPQPPAGAGR